MPTATPALATSTSASGRKFTVKYRSAANVYLDAGRAAGLGEGDRLRVTSGQATVAELEIAYVAELSASCTIVSETRPVRAGDMAVLVSAARRAPAATSSVAAAGAGKPVAAPAPAPSPNPEEKRSVPWGRARGSASFGYYRSWDQTESALDFEQRTARLDLGVYEIGGQPLAFTLRGRSRQDIRARTLSQRTPASERTDRLYEVALRYEPPSDRVGFEVGRIGIYRFVGIGYLDGFLGRFRPLPGLQVGAFGGRVADIESLGFDGTGQKYGGFVRLAPGGRYSSSGHDVMLAFVRENADGDVSREYLSLESRFGNGSRWSLFQRAELDLNSGWRQEVTGQSTQLSNVSLSGNLRVTPSAWAFVSYDGRRNYRYYRNRVVPEEVFDDLLHQGLRAGVNLSRPGGFGATAGLGMSLKEPDPRHPELDIANAYSGNAGAAARQPVLVRLLGRHRRLGVLERLHGRGPSHGPRRPPLRRWPRARPLLRPLPLPPEAHRGEPQHAVAAPDGPRRAGAEGLPAGGLRVRHGGRPEGAAGLSRARDPLLSGVRA